MKTLPASHIPGSTDQDRMDHAVRQMFTVSKTEMLKREKKWKLAQAKKKAAQKTG